jgi:hypothetical protein
MVSTMPSSMELGDEHGGSCIVIRYGVPGFEGARVLFEDGWWGKSAQDSMQ